MFLIENLLKYVYAKNYPNRDWFDKVVAKNKTAWFLQYMVVVIITEVLLVQLSGCFEE